MSFWIKSLRGSTNVMKVTFFRGEDFTEPCSMYSGSPRMYRARGLYIPSSRILPLPAILRIVSGRNVMMTARVMVEMMRRNTKIERKPM